MFQRGEIIGDRIAIGTSFWWTNTPAGVGKTYLSVSWAGVTRLFLYESITTVEIIPCDHKGQGGEMVQINAYTGGYFDVNSAKFEE